MLHWHFDKCFTQQMRFTPFMSFRSTLILPARTCSIWDFFCSLTKVTTTPLSPSPFNSSIYWNAFVYLSLRPSVHLLFYQCSLVLSSCFSIVSAIESVCRRGFLSTKSPTRDLQSTILLLFFIGYSIICFAFSLPLSISLFFAI